MNRTRKHVLPAITLLWAVSSLPGVAAERVCYETIGGTMVCRNRLPLAARIALGITSSVIFFLAIMLLICVGRSRTQSQVYNVEAAQMRGPPPIVVPDYSNEGNIVRRQHTTFRLAALRIPREQCLITEINPRQPRYMGDLAMCLIRPLRRKLPLQILSRTLSLIGRSPIGLYLCFFSVLGATRSKYWNCSSPDCVCERTVPTTSVHWNRERAPAILGVK
ncbi:hypothetical protein BDQ17DRAFT_380699 [Cyathus striatus]|nr:hypothetical protein BDQ17DRAFT_380699 [Cyathus striatus]